MSLYLARPIAGNITKCRLNVTLHGRSRYRRKNVSGHNVIKGYLVPGTGDALDIFIPPDRPADAGAPVYATHDGVVTHIGDRYGKLACLYLEGKVGNRKVTSVYAHVNYKSGVLVGSKIGRGQVIGYIDDDLRDPHLHFELWDNGSALTARTPLELARKMAAEFDPTG